MTDYGNDISCIEDVDPNLTVVEGPIVVAQAVLRRLQTPRGKLWYDPEYGTDIRAFLNGPRSRFGIAQAVVTEAEKDPRVHRAQCTVSLTPDTITIQLTLTLDDGPFALVISVKALTVELVSFDKAA